MPVITMAGVVPTTLKHAFDTYQVYNCLDAAITAQLVPVMKAEMNNNHLSTYDRRMRTQALCLEMSLKGFPINLMDMLQLVKELEAEEAKALRILKRLTDAVGFAGTLNPNSPPQVASFFYDHLRIPVIWKWDPKTKTRKRSTDRDTLGKLQQQRPIASAFVNCILCAREARKFASVFKRGLEPGHPPVLRCNFTPSGTETGRLSSQQNVYSRGTNGQNLTPRVRRVIAAPPGYAIVYPDLKTGESFAVGYISGDQTYIDACKSEDLHTTCARLIWPRDVAWTGNDKLDRRLADGPFYRFFSYRDTSKRVGHATNYYGLPPHISAQHGIPKELVAAFQESYFDRFPGIRDWQLRVIEEVQRSGILTNPLGSQRRFWGRPDDPATHREAIAHLPQSTVAEVMNEGLIQVQQWIVKERLQKIIDLRAQVHDAGFFLVPIRELDWVVPELNKRIVFPVDFGPLGEMVIPVDSKVGKNWDEAKFDPTTGRWENPQGLRKWKPGKELHFA